MMFVWPAHHDNVVHAIVSEHLQEVEQGRCKDGKVWNIFLNMGHLFVIVFFIYLLAHALLARRQNATS